MENREQAFLINQIWHKYDVDGNGELDYKETKTYVKDTIGDISDEIFQHIFNTFDKDDSGAIGKEEMVEFLKLVN